MKQAAGVAIGSIAAVWFLRHGIRRSLERFVMHYYLRQEEATHEAQ